MSTTEGRTGTAFAAKGRAGADIQRLGSGVAVLRARGRVDRDAWDGALALLAAAVAEGRDEFVLDLSEATHVSPCAAMRLAEIADTTAGREVPFVVVPPANGRLTSIEVLARRREWPIEVTFADAAATLLRLPV